MKSFCVIERFPPLRRHSIRPLPVGGGPFFILPINKVLFEHSPKLRYSLPIARLAQLVEHLIDVERVAGSNPASRTSMESIYPQQTIILYHGNCLDGFSAAYAAWKKFGDEAAYIPLDRGEELPKGLEDKDLYFLDFTYEKPDMDHFVNIARSVTVLDHHSGVREVVEAMPNFVFDNDRSGATIAWDYFHPGIPRSLLLEFIQDDDIFTFALPDTRAVVCYLGVREFSFALWEEIAQLLENHETRELFLEKARAYAEYFELLAQLSVEKAKLVSFEGYECYYATAHPFKPMKSLVGNLLAKKKGPFALVVAAHPKGFGVSIRGDGSVDVSHIAAKYGGNGHKNSSGFLIPASGPMPWTMIESHEDTRD